MGGKRNWVEGEENEVEIENWKGKGKRGKWGEMKKSATDLEQEKGNGNESNGDEPERRARPANAQLLVHGGREQREASAKGRAEEVVAGQHTRRVLRVRVRKVIKDRVEEQEGADGEPGRADDGDDPMDIGPRRPSEPEETQRDAKGADEGRRQTPLGL